MPRDVAFLAELYQRWHRKQGVVLRQEHKTGEKMVVEWGITMPIYDPNGGPVKEAHLFVAILEISRVLFGRNF